MRNLVLTTPFMRGPDVERVQTALRKATGRKLAVDGEYGPATAAAVAYWKRYVAGYPERAMRGHLGTGIGGSGLAFLEGARAVPLTWKARAAARRRNRPKPALGARISYAAVKFRGITEDPAGSNKVPELAAEAKALGLSSWYQAMGWPWCAFFGFLMALKVGSKAAELGLRKARFNALYTVDILATAQRAEHGLSVVGASEAAAGDFALIDFPGGDPRVDHLEVLSGPVVGGSYPTTGGNTSPDGGGSQANGGGVFPRVRYVAQTRAFVRLT